MSSISVSKRSLDPERPRALLQQHEEPPAPDAAEAVAAGDRPLSPVVDGDIVPVSEMRADRLGAFRVVPPEVVERLVGEDHAPPEGVVRAVALEDGDLIRRIAELHADREIQSRRTAAEACRLHASLRKLTGFTHTFPATCIARPLSVTPAGACEGIAAAAERIETGR